MPNKRIHEFTVFEASDFLGVSTRSVLNYIQARELEAIKVGKSWFIKAPSIEAFSQKYGFQVKPKETNLPIQNQILQSQNKERSTSSVKNLKAFQLSKTLLNDLETLTNLVKDPTLKDRVKHLYYESVELLGSGYYTFEANNKKNIYNRAREKIGALLSLFYAHHETQFYLDPPPIITKIEEDLLPALSGLIRKMETVSKKRHLPSNEY